jgi:hypothetical protein
MKLSEKLDAVIDGLLSGDLIMEAFQPEFERLYNSAGDQELTVEQELYYGQIFQKSEFTCRNPLPKEVKYGYLNHSQFKEYVKGYLGKKTT